MKDKLIQSKYIFGILVIYVIIIIVVAYFIQSVLNLDQALAFGQLFLEILLLPTVIIGFIITIEEFRKAQAIPDVDLYWETELGKFEQEIIFKIPANGSAKMGLRPVLINNGRAVAIWYALNFDIPLEYLYFEELELNKQNRLQLPVERYIANKWAIHVGLNENWRIDFNELKEMRLSFISNGQVASYPGYPQPLGILDITLGSSGIDYPQIISVPYSIATDKSQPKYGSLKIKFQRNP